MSRRRLESILVVWIGNCPNCVDFDVFEDADTVLRFSLQMELYRNVLIVCLMLFNSRPIPSLLYLSTSTSRSRAHAKSFITSHISTYMTSVLASLCIRSKLYHLAS